MEYLFTGNDVIKLYTEMVGSWPDNSDHDVNEFAYIFDQNCIGRLKKNQEPIFNFRQAMLAIAKAKARRDLILAGRWTPQTRDAVEMVEDIFLSVHMEMDSR